MFSSENSEVISHPLTFLGGIMSQQLSLDFGQVTPWSHDPINSRLGIVPECPKLVDPAAQLIGLTPSVGNLREVGVYNHDDEKCFACKLCELPFF